jgi:hypothetical protein
MMVGSSMSSPTIDFDLRCNQCGYILRGLDLDGRCPECGKPIAQAALELLESRIDDDASARRALGTTQLRQIVRGGIYLLTAGAITVIVGLLPQGLFRYRTMSRTILFCMVCVAAGFSLAGMWSFAGRDGRRRWQWDDSYGWGLRATTVATLVFLLSVALIADSRHPLSLAGWSTLRWIVGDLLVWAIPLGGALFFVRVRRIARQLGSPILATLVGFLVCVSSALLALLAAGGPYPFGYHFDSLALLSSYPVIPAGPMGLWEELPRQLYRPFGEENLIFWIIVLVCVISTLSVAAVTWRAWRASRASITSEDVARRTQASSAP